MDIIDTAAEIEELQRNAALSAHRIDRNAISAEHCGECGSKIPDSKRKAIPSVKLCVDCAELSERQAKIFRG